MRERTRSSSKNIISRPKVNDILFIASCLWISAYSTCEVNNKHGNAKHYCTCQHEVSESPQETKINHIIRTINSISIAHFFRWLAKFEMRAMSCYPSTMFTNLPITGDWLLNFPFINPHFANSVCFFMNSDFYDMLDTYFPNQQVVLDYRFPYKSNNFYQSIFNAPIIKRVAFNF